MKIRNIILLLGCSVLVGCNSPRKNVEESTDVMRSVNVQDSSAILNRETKEISWDEAVALLRERNPRLREARASFVNADAQIERVWLDLLPATSISYSIDRALTDIVKSGGGSGTLSVFSFVNIPGVVSLRMRYYGAVLSKVRTEYAYELTEREQQIALWKLFRDYGRYLERKAWAAYTRKLAYAGLDVSGADLDAYLSDYALEREEQALQTRFGMLFGSMQCRWIPKGDAPVVDYGKEIPDVGNADFCGLLQLQYAAVELEGSRLRALGATLAFWPDIGVSLSGPPVYQNTDGTNSSWSASNASLIANMNWQIDTQLASLYNLNETKRQVALIRDRLILENQTRIQNLLNAKRSLEVQAKQAASVERRLFAVRTAPPPVTMEQFSAFTSELRSLIEQRSNLSAERDVLNALFWFQDETKWTRANPDDFAKSDRQIDKESDTRF